MRQIPGLFLFACVCAFGGDSFNQSADGVIAWTPAAAAQQIKGEYAATRWGMYDVELQLEAAAAGTVKAVIGAKELSTASKPNETAVKVGRVYIEKAGKIALSAEAPAAIKALVLSPASEGKPIVQSGDLSISLHARDSIVHGTNLRFEPKPEKNTLGFWSKKEDWVSWDFELKKPGKFIVFAMHGSNGGSEIEIAAGEQKLNWTTKNTGSFHTFTYLEVGTLNLETPGTITLTLKPNKKVGGAVMDLREVILLPVLK